MHSFLQYLRVWLFCQSTIPYTKCPSLHCCIALAHSALVCSTCLQNPSTTATNIPPHALHTANNVLLVQFTPAPTQCSGELIHSRPVGAVPLAACPGGVRPPPTATRKPPAVDLMYALCKPPNTYFRPLHPLTHNPLADFDTKLAFNTVIASQHSQRELQQWCHNCSTRCI